MGNSVAGKIALGAMLLVLFAVGTTSGVAIWRQTSAMEAAEARAADLLSSAVAISSASDIVEHDMANLEQTARRLKEGNETLLWIAIHDAEGKTLTEWPKSASTSGTTGLLVRPIALYGQHFGEIRMVFDRTPVEAARSEILETTVQLAAVLLIIALLGSLVWANFFARPIVTLADAAEKVSRGDLTVSVPVPGRDEIGQLTGRFNGMVLSLARSRAELERTYNELSALYDVSRIINSTSKRDEILRLNIETLATGVGFSPIAILLEIDHQWVLAARSGRPSEASEPVNMERIGVKDAVTAGEPVLIDPSLLPAEWGFTGGGSTLGAALRSGSHTVGLLLVRVAENSDANEARTVLGVIASQIAPPVLITLMAERVEERLANPFEYVLRELDDALEKARGFGVGLAVLSFRVEDDLWKQSGSKIEEVLLDLEGAVRGGIPDAEMVMRSGVGRVIAVVPGWGRPEARSALMKLALPHPEFIESRALTSPEDGASALELLAAVEGIRRV